MPGHAGLRGDLAVATTIFWRDGWLQSTATKFVESDLSTDSRWDCQHGSVAVERTAPDEVRLVFDHITTHKPWMYDEGWSVWSMSGQAGQKAAWLASRIYQEDREDIGGVPDFWGVEGGVGMGNLPSRYSTR